MQLHKSWHKIFAALSTKIEFQELGYLAVRRAPSGSQPQVLDHYLYFLAQSSSTVGSKLKSKKEL